MWNLPELHLTTRKLKKKPHWNWDGGLELAGLTPMCGIFLIRKETSAAQVPHEEQGVPAAHQALVQGSSAWKKSPCNFGL